MTRPVSPLEQLIHERMATGLYASEDELLTEALQALDVVDEELSAIQEGIDSVDRGDPGTALDEVFQKLCNTHKITDLP